MVEIDPSITIIFQVIVQVFKMCAFTEQSHQFYEVRNYCFPYYTDEAGSQNLTKVTQMVNDNTGM